MQKTLDDELIELAVICTHDPVKWILSAYDWGFGELRNYQKPKAWQLDIANDIKNHLQNKETRYMPLLIAVASGHGIGKSAEIGMIINWAMSTCEDCKIVVTANTETQLRTKTSPEVGKWTRLSLTADWFDVQTMSITSKDTNHKKDWRCDMSPWSTQNTEAFAGLHNEGKRIVLIFDEASGIDDKIWEVAEGALTDENTEIIWIAFGNPTRNTGRFRECFRKYAHRWIHRQIDSRTVEGTNKAQIEKWAEDYGVNSDWFKVRVRGMFPSSSSKQFIGEDDVDAAFGRIIKEHQYNFAPKILTVDPAWEGDDDFVIGLRQGLFFKILRVIPKNDNDVQMANLICQLEDEHQADAVFIDGGYGTGIKSVGDTLGRDWMLVWFGGESSDLGYLNKRSEMWGEIKKWLKNGGCIEDDNGLRDELLAPQTVPRLDGKIQLEAKKDMKKRGIRSPNKADALALSFAYPVQKKQRGHDFGGGKTSRNDYMPY